MILFRSSLVLIVVLALTGCNKNSVIKENYHFQKNGIDISVNAFVKKDSGGKNGNFAINNLFDGNNQTGCLLQAKHESEIRLDFSKPVFLKNVTLHADQERIKNISPSIKLAKQVAILAYNDPSDIFPAGGSKINLQYSDKPNFINLDRSFLKVLKVKSLVIEIDRQAEREPNTALWLSEMQVDFSQSSDFKPTMTVSSIIDKFGKENGPWFFNAKDKLSEDAKNEVLINIIYNALKGDAFAEKMLKNYSPPQADEGEWASFLQEWYESVKALQ